VTAGNNHPAGRPLYVSGVSNAAGAELRSADGTAGISIGSDTIQAVGTDQSLTLAGKGKGGVSIGSSGTPQPLTVTGALSANKGVTIAQAATTVSGLDVTFGTRVTAGNNHPAGRPLYVSGVSNAAGAELRSADGTAGISIGSDTIQAVGTDQTLKLAGKGTGGVEIQTLLTATKGLTVTGAGVTIGVAAATGVTAGSQNLTVNGSLTVTGTGTSIKVEDWKILTLSPGWLMSGATVKYFKDPCGIVHMRGIAVSASGNTWDTVAILPSGYRPSAFTQLSGIGNDDFYSGTWVAVPVFVDCDGTIKFTPPYWAQPALDFACIHFLAEQ
jgi:hypothetical protein